MTNSNVDKKIGRKKAGTWGRTSGGYSPAAAKQSKRAGSKGARKVAKQELRLREGDKYSPENIAKMSPEQKAKEKAKTLKKLKKVAPWMAKGLGEEVELALEGGTIMVKQSFLDSLKKTHPEDHARLMKKFKGQKKDVIGTKDSYPRPVKEAKDYSDHKKNHYNLYTHEKTGHPDKQAHSDIHKAVTHKSGSPKHMNKAMDKHSKHGATDTHSREAIVGHFMKHHADKKGKTWSLKESSPHPGGKGTELYKKSQEYKDMRAGEFAKAHGNRWKEVRKAKRLTKEETSEILDITPDQIDEIRRSPYHGRPSDPGGKGKSRNLTAEIKKEKEKHDTGGFRISDADAKKAKARLKKKYGKFARHFKELRVFKTNSFTGKTKVTRAARKRGEELSKQAAARVKSTTVKQKFGEEKLQELSPKTLHNYMTKRLSQTPPHDMDSKQHKNIATAVKKIKKAGQVKEEQRRVIESLSNLASRGIDHKPTKTKEFNIKTATKQELRNMDIKGQVGNPKKKK